MGKSFTSRKFITQITFVIAALFAPASLRAYTVKEGNVSATLGWLVHQTNFDRTYSGARAPLQGDLALILAGDINTRGALEIGIYHLNKQYFRDVNAQYVGDAVETLHITMGYRQWLSPRFSLALSFATSYSMGYVTRFHNDYAPAAGIDTSASDTTEYAFDLSAQYDLLTLDRVTFALSTFYSLSVTGKPNEKADHYGAMIGLRYFIQEKQAVEKPPEAI